MNDTARRYNINISGRGDRPIVFAHGFGCDQNMWRYVAPEFERDHRVVLFDYLGFGQSDATAYDPKAYTSLEAYARDVVEVAEAAQVDAGVFVGHSVSAMIGVLAANRAPELFSDIVLIAPSPRYIDDEDYAGGFSREDIDELLDSLDGNFVAWSHQMAPVIMGNADRPALADELATSFCRADPRIARQFAKLTFLSDNRADLPRLKSRALILQCSNDVIAPESVGRYVHHAIPHSKLVLMTATGHCPNLSAPEETAGAIRAFLDG